MNRETIEKTAKEYAKDKYGGENAKQWAIAQIHAGRDGFIEGSNWRINSVWHDISECKDVKRKILVEYKNGHFDVLPDIRDLKVVEDLVVRVTYIDELLPDRKEDE